ncbi:MAG: kynureninase [Spirosomataceae bacterium]
MTTPVLSLDLARQLNENDPLRSFKELFRIPQRAGQPVVYLVGNSLGLQPITTATQLQTELDTWANWGVEGWFAGNDPWIPYLKHLKKPMAQLVGATPSEVTVMNNLTVNLHLLLTSFYQPQGKRVKILTEAGAFPSDQYALETHVQQRGLQPDEVIVEIFPREGESLLRTEDIINHIEQLGDSLALVMMGGINYYTGQWYDMVAITAAAHQTGALVGFDLAHAAGNVPLHLHDWEVDFAAWCCYKYLNAGPGGVAGAFVHQQHHEANWPRLAGWWGYDEATRFQMKKGFIPMQGTDGWQVSTPPILLMACLRASLAIFDQVGLESLRAKSIQLTGLLEQIICQFPQIQLLTPTNPAERGCQLSLLVEQNGKQLFEHLMAQGIWGDWREPNCIRLSPVPLYNSFEDLAKVEQALHAFWG